VTRKIGVVVTARPSYSRIRSVLRAVQDHPDLELQLVVGASALLDRYGNVVKHMERDGFDVASRVYMVVEGENLAAMAKTTGLGLIELTTAFDNLRPDVVVSVADRYETLATAVAAAYMNIPLAHIQGGEVTGSIDEKVRHAVTKLSDLHFVANDIARDRVIRMGEDPDTVFNTGCPSIDVVTEMLQRGDEPFDPYELYGGVGSTPDISGGYSVVLQHPVTTEYGEARTQMAETMQAVAAFGRPALVFWPNVDGGSDGTSEAIRSFREQHGDENTHFFKNMTPEDFLRLLKGSKCIVGNSSVAIRECAFLGVPAINIGTRQSGRDRGGNVTDVGYDRTAIAEAMSGAWNAGAKKTDTLYGDGKSGPRIAELLATLPLKHEKRLSY
jgi:UDP-hydrolysing UDP-N-acetyl-D-glucosamine 2-epimerase